MTTPPVRSSGLLLHPTSLPGRWGIGDLGSAAYTFVDFLAATGQQLWQVMPLGPTGYGDSPYQSFSAFAGNPMLISPDLLREEGLLADEDSAATLHFPDAAVDYGVVIPFKTGLLHRSFERFKASASTEQRATFSDFLARNHTWLTDYALFAALKEAHNYTGWNSWEPEIARYEPDAVAQWAATLSDQVQFHSYLQFQFYRQWTRLKTYANERGVKVIGDIPIFVAYDSADLWANRDVFALDEDGNPTVVAGVPPDYFSATGQRWGNPLYRWDALAKREYGWWVERFRSMFTLFDIVRLDHFRGFVAYWEVPAEEETAINGRWVSGPGAALFDTVRQALGDVPIIAEDLGLITPDVIALRDKLDFPGMKVLQFAFGGSPDELYLPHNYERRCVVYTGTHDNDTTLGWWRSAPDHVRSHVQMYLGRDGNDISWDFIRLALSSVAEMAIVPLQDVLTLGSEARMNTPGLPSGNWSWRYTPDMLDQHIAGRLRTLTELYGRLPRGDDKGTR
jgi:4-alpha-glucanotransferase